jgi:glucans biosynthesis protein
MVSSLAFGGAGLTSAFGQRSAAAQAPGAHPLAALLVDGQRFSHDAMVEAARQMARRPMQAPALPLPDPFASLNAENYHAIRPRPERAIWAGDLSGIALEPLHRGFVYQSPVQVAVLEDGLVRRLAYDPALFSFGRLQPPAQISDIGFAGFRVTVQQDNQSRELIGFQGATFLRAQARGQVAGLVARGLAVRTADPRGEEFPAFRAFWVEKPSVGGPVLIHAIAESDSIVAAFRFTVRAGEVTLVDTEITLVARTAVEHIGLAAMQGTFLFGANDRRAVDDIRPAVHDVQGLQMLTGQGEWIWRPLNNPEQLQISSFVDSNPRGFGLMQRDRDPASYHDDDQRPEARPSVWIEPIGDWGPGHVQLVEIPSDSEINDNIVCFWRPRAPIAAGTEHMIAYRQHWCWAPPERPPLALCVGSRVGRGQQRRRRFSLDFAGEILGGDVPGDLRMLLWGSAGALHLQRLQPMPQRKTVRIQFDLDPGNETAVELRVALAAGERVMSETWLYRWTP